MLRSAIKMVNVRATNANGTNAGCGGLTMIDKWQLVRKLLEYEIGGDYPVDETVVYFAQTYGMVRGKIVLQTAYFPTVDIRSRVLKYFAELEPTHD